MNAGEIDRRYWAALGIVREAGQLAADYYRRRESLRVERKGLQDLVSEADRCCEDKIVGALQRLFPDDAFLGEERGRQNFGSEIIWVVDPIDGTANFLRGIPFWCVSLGLLAKNEPVIGVIYNPISEELYAARKNGGATLNGKRIKVSEVERLDDARLGVGFSYRRPVDPHATVIKSLLDAHCEYSRLGSGALGLAMTADGRLDGYWEAHINVWDVAAGLCIVKEAGGWTNDFLSNNGLTKGNPILATNGRLTGELGRLLRLF